MSELKKEPRVCESCGGKFIPVRKDQRLCPDCRAGKHKYAAAKKPGDVEHYTLGETPEQAMPEPEIPEKPKPVDAVEVEVTAEELGEAMARIAPEVSIVRPTSCTFKFYIGGK